MRISMFGSRCSCDPPKRNERIVYVEVPVSMPTPPRIVAPVSPNPGNPNPTRFTIWQIQGIGRFTIVRVHYPDCRNFEGEKILVFEGVSVKAVKSLRTLDPHFCDGAHVSPIARFVPTKQGWKYAVAFCQMMADIA